jgi:hypothetical protein
MALGVAVATGGLGRAERLSTEVTAPVLAFVSGANLGCAGTYAINWGDGSPSVKGALPNRKALTFRHLYRVPGEYRLVEKSRFATNSDPNRCYYGGGKKLFYSTVLERRFSCSASSRPRPLWCRQLSTRVRFENPRPVPRPPPNPAAYTEGKRPPACRTAQSCFNRRVEVFRVALRGTQTTTWTQDWYDGRCQWNGGGTQTIVFTTGSSQPAAIWVQSGLVIAAPPASGGGFRFAEGKDRVEFVGPSSRMRDLFDEGVQRLTPTLPVRMKANRRYEQRVSCPDADVQVFRGSDCGSRQANGSLSVWLPAKSLRGPRRFIFWGGDLNNYPDGETFNPYHDCLVFGRSGYYPKDKPNRLRDCLFSKYQRFVGRGQTPGSPHFMWTGPTELLFLQDTEFDGQDCLSGAAPIFDGRAFLDCARKTIVVRQPGFSITDARQGGGEGSGDLGSGWTSTTKVTWDFTFKRVGCGRTG